MKNSIFLFLIIGVIFFSACQSMISEVDIEGGQKKLIVHSYIYPGMDTVKVMLTSSSPLYSTTQLAQGPSSLEVKDAQVVIRNRNNEFPLIYDNFYKQYISTELEINAGETYHLEIITPSGEKITASCTVPDEEPPAIEVSTILVSPDFPYEKVINFSFRDLEGEGHFYRVTGVYKIQYGPEPQDFWWNTIYMQMGEEFVSDKNKDGQSFLYKTVQMITFEEEYYVPKLFIALTDKHYYNYHRSIAKFEGEDPFSEPAPIYSNIEGGLGVFAAFNGSSIDVDLE